MSENGKLIPYVILYGSPFIFGKKTGDTSCFDNKWLDAARLIVKTFKETTA